MKNTTCNFLAIILAIAIVNPPIEGVVHARPTTLTAINGSVGKNTVLYVKPAGMGDCSSWDSACELQTALSNSGSGNQIWVAAGTYKPSASDRTISFNLKSGIAIYGGFPADGGNWEDRDWDANPTILSGDVGTIADGSDNSYHVVTAYDVDNTTVLDGFVIKDGKSNENGGGIYLSGSSLSLVNITIMNNWAYDGGGVYVSLSSSNPSLINVTFSNNTADSEGGGIYNSWGSPILENVNFLENMADWGGAFYNHHGSPTLTQVSFTNNSAYYDGGAMKNYYVGNSASLSQVSFTGNTAVNGNGGGMLNYQGSPTLVDATFTANSADVRGGGIYNDLSSYPKLTNVTFFDNSTNENGGGIYNNSSNPTLVNVTITGNLAGDGGGGIYNSSSSPILTNVTLVNNSASYGGGIYGGSPVLTNVILWGNTPNQVLGGTPVITYSDIQGGYTGEGNINQDPLLGPLADNGGFIQTHALLTGSPAIDAGSPTTCPASDQRLFPRPLDGDGNGIFLCDMGAVEFGTPWYIYLPSILR